MKAAEDLLNEPFLALPHRYTEQTGSRSGAGGSMRCDRK
jgi:hypothetical protein